MKKDGSEKKDNQEKLSLDAALDATGLIFGAKEPQNGLNEEDQATKDDGEDEPVRREQIGILDSLKNPGGKRVH